MPLPPPPPPRKTNDPRPPPRKAVQPPPPPQVAPVSTPLGASVEKKPWSEDVPAGHALLIIVGFIVTAFVLVRVGSCFVPDEEPEPEPEVTDLMEIARFLDLPSDRRPEWVKRAGARFGVDIGFDSERAERIANCMSNVSDHARVGDIRELATQTIADVFGRCSELELADNLSPGGLSIGPGDSIARWQDLDERDQRDWVKKYLAEGHAKAVRNGLAPAQRISRCMEHTRLAVALHPDKVRSLRTIDDAFSFCAGMENIDALDADGQVKQ